MKKFLIAALASMFLAGFAYAGEGKDCKACADKKAKCEKCEKACEKKCDKEAKKECCPAKKEEKK